MSGDLPAGGQGGHVAVERIQLNPDVGHENAVSPGGTAQCLGSPAPAPPAPHPQVAVDV